MTFELKPTHAPLDAAAVRKSCERAVMKAPNGFDPQGVPLRVAVAMDAGSRAEDIAHWLSERGAQWMSYLGSGQSAVVFDLGDDRVARIHEGERTTPPESRWVNPQLDHAQFGPLQVEVYPKLETGNVGWKDVHDISAKLERDHGVQEWDSIPENVGRTPDGQLKVIDPEAVVLP